LKKVLSGRLGQVDFSFGHVTFLSHLPDGQGMRQVIWQRTKSLKSKLRLAQGNSASKL